MCYIVVCGHSLGAKSLGFDPGPGCYNSFGPTDSWFPGQDSDLDCLTRNGGRPTIRPTGMKPIRGRVFFQLGARTRPFLFGHRPARRSELRRGSGSLGMVASN